MREQIVTPRSNGRGSANSTRGRSSAVVQKPSRRGGNSRDGVAMIRTIIGYVPLVAKVVFAVLIGVFIFAGYRAAGSASFFEARHVDISGTSRTSTDEVKSVVRRAVMANGVWRADLNEVSAEIERLPWVRKAVVSRVLPDGLRIRIIERVPRAVVRTSSGKFIWVDEDAVSLSQMSPNDQMPAFFIRGWDESETKEARTENRERIKKYIEMANELSALGLSERVSEVNLGDSHDIRALLAGDDAQIEVRLGERNLGTRLQKALKVLDEQRSTPLGPYITYLVASQDGKITVGHNAGAPTLKSEGPDSTTADNQVDTAGVNNRGNTQTTSAKNARDKKAPASNRDDRPKQDREQKVKPPSDAKGETRARRVE